MRRLDGDMHETLTNDEHTMRNGTRGPEPPLSSLAALAARPFGSLDDVIQEALRLLGDWIGIRLSMIHRLEGDDIVVSHVHDRIGLGIQPPVTVPRSATFCDTVLATLTPLIVLDADRKPWCDLPGKQIVGTKSYIGVPIILNDSRLYGTLCAHDRRALDLGPHEVDLMLVLARIVASHIERDEAARIEADSARRLAVRNAELAEAVEQLRALQEITDSIAAQLDLKSLLETVLASAVRLLGAHGGAISLVGETVDAPRRLTATYNLPERVQDEQIPAREGLMGQVIAARGPVIVQRYAQLDAPLRHSSFHDLGPWIAIPIWWQEAILGTFGIGARDPERVFGERDVQLLTMLANHAAVAIENARLYAASRELGAAEERNRLAAEIHDTLAQSLLALTFQLRAARGLFVTSPERAVTELLEAEERARAALEEARRSVWNLGPASLEAGTLVEALQGELAASERDGLPGRLVVSGAARPLAAEAQLALYRTAQEALANARKHARASHAEVSLDFGPTAVTLTVADDGIGFEAGQVTGRGPRPDGGFGLVGMADRLRRVGGAVQIESDPPRRPGTRVIATVRYDAPAHPAPPIGAVTRAVERIRVVVADDHPATRAGIAALLTQQPDIEVVATATNGEEALALVETLQPDVLMIDLRMPRLSGVEAIARLGKLGVPTKAVVVTTFAQDELVFQAMRAGARGYLLKDAGPDDLAAAVRVVSAGGTLLTPLVAGKLAEGLSSQERLTTREREVLELLARGLPDKEIAAHLGTSVKTANFHAANVIAKLGAQNRAEAVRLAYERGLLAD
jgi:DNA-binding NarL/FixJ family response regulator/signal transduction histidine kinase